MIGRMSYETRVLELMEVAIQRQLPRGVHGATLYEWLPEHLDALVVGLRGYVLRDQGGDRVSATRVVGIPVQPWWIPKFLWNRLKVKRFEWTVGAQPVWTYPEASIAVKLGEPVRIVIDKEVSWLEQ